MNTSIKGFILVSSAKHGRTTITVHALTIAEAKQIAFDEHGIEYYFKGYQS